CVRGRSRDGSGAAAVAAGAPDRGPEAGGSRRRCPQCTGGWIVAAGRGGIRRPAPSDAASGRAEAARSGVASGTGKSSATYSGQGAGGCFFRNRAGEGGAFGRGGAGSSGRVE